MIKAILLTTAAAMSLQAAAIPGIYNTGVDNSNAVLAGGSADPHWTVVYNGGSSFGPATVQSDGNLFGGCCGLSPWMLNGPNSKWISIVDNRFQPTGQVSYDLMFDLTGLDPTTASITGGMAADGNVLAVLINGSSTGQSTSYNTWDHFTSFSINSGFQSGLNVLTFAVNHEDGDYDAFRAELTGTASLASAPEPGTLVLMGAGLIFAGVWKRRGARLVFLTAGLAAAAVTSGAATFSPAADFSTASNPAGVWSYGYESTLGGALTLFATNGSTNEVEYWKRAATDMAAGHNTNAGSAGWCGSCSVPGGDAIFAPGNNGDFAVFRFTSPAADNYAIVADFFGADFSRPTTTDVHIQVNSSTSLFSDTIVDLARRARRATRDR
ncbi:MAG TPA: PEP-CTERM sorting domain-containing protein [Candidatus Solibacter sp.]|nr:PEP-CTERM sorting domain-containing protein [Candidatus Solibacter sp.]